MMEWIPRMYLCALRRPLVSVLWVGLSSHLCSRLYVFSACVALYQMLNVLVYFLPWNEDVVVGHPDS